MIRPYKPWIEYFVHFNVMDYLDALWERKKCAKPRSR